MPSIVLEKDIERAVTAYAKRHGWLPYKWVSPGHAGVPDRLYFQYGRVCCIEFKALGKYPTKLQQKHHRQLRNKGIEVHVIDNVTEGKYLFDTLSFNWDPPVSESDTD